MASHFGLFAPQKIAARKKITRMKKSGSAGVVQDRKFYTSVMVYFLLMLGIEMIIIRFLKKQIAYL